MSNKKKKSKGRARLQVRREVLRNLTPAELAQAPGGNILSLLDPLLIPIQNALHTAPCRQSRPPG